jgi:chromatin remodeling complex protein RSC6
MSNKLTIELYDSEITNIKKITEKKMEKEKEEKIPVYIKKLEENLILFEKNMELQQHSFNELHKQFLLIQKNTRKIIDKHKSQYQKNKNPRKCGFAKEGYISEDLCNFMGLEIGSKIPRTQVTKFLMEYIKTHELVNPANKKQVVPDEPLWLILGDEARTTPDKITHFTLQKYMNRHFSKVDV